MPHVSPEVLDGLRSRRHSAAAVFGAVTLSVETLSIGTGDPEATKAIGSLLREACDELEGFLSELRTVVTQLNATHADL
jgi:hypothetical protein